MRLAACARLAAPARVALRPGRGLEAWVELDEITVAVAALFVEQEKSRVDVARAVGLTPTELSAMALIGFGEDITPSALSARLQLVSGSITAMVDRLEQSGLVRRAPHPTDRRSLIILPTEAGRRVAETVAVTLQDVLRRATAQIRPALLADTIKVLALITDELATSVPPAGRSVRADPEAESSASSPLSYD